MKHVLTIEGDWAQIWGILDALPHESELRGMTLHVPARIGHEYAVTATLRLKGFDVNKDPTCLGYIAYCHN